MNACDIRIQLNLYKNSDLPAYYDLILLDIKMPILNAFELCKKILDNTSQIASITASKEYNENFRKKHYPELLDNVIYSKTNQ
jgi:CheY-like chemotaxis protein